ncbi:MAG: DUF3139 domain-containing protein [Dysgonamonadaceae bacterium]|nr:DUF3139 domain-containing protein [Dysgonamonadaceae bacterium]
MKRKGIILAVIMVVIILSCSIYVFAGTKKAEKLMWEYLDEKGYMTTEIQSIDVNHSFMNIILSYNEWNIAVVYSDEPTSIYSYHIKNSSIVESGVSGTTDKEDLKH